MCDFPDPHEDVVQEDLYISCLAVKRNGFMELIDKVKFPDPPEDVVQEHPYLFCLAVNNKDWEELKNDPYNFNAELFVPLLNPPSCEKLEIIWDKPRCSSKRLQDLRIVTVEEFEVLWKQVCNAAMLDKGQKRSKYYYLASGITKWIRTSRILKESYRIVCYTAVMKLVEEMTSLNCDGYFQFLWLFDLLIAISDLEGAMNKEIFEWDGSREYLTLFKKWKVAMDKLFTQYSAIYLEIPEDEDYNNTILDLIEEGDTDNLFPEYVVSFVQEEQKLLIKLIKENCRRVQVQERAGNMLYKFFKSTDFSQEVNIGEYLHFELFEMKDYFLVFNRTREFIEKGEVELEPDDEYKYEMCLLTLLRSVPVMPLVVRNFFPKIIPQTVSVELLPNDVVDNSKSHWSFEDRSNAGDNWLLESLLNIFKNKLCSNLYNYTCTRFDSYMSVLTLWSNDNIEQQAFKNPLQYLQPVTNLSDQNLADVDIPNVVTSLRYLQSRPMIEADTFYEKIFEEGSEIKFLHGERLYALADHLRLVEEIRNRFPEYSERACNMFCEEMNSTLDFGSLLIYYHVLKKYLYMEQVERLEEQLRQRQQAEQIFLEYFYNPRREEYYYDPQVKQIEMKNWTEVYPYVFFLSFVKVFLFHTQTEQRKRQQKCINRLVDTLESIPKLKELLTRQRITPEMYFHEFLYKKLTTSSKSAPLEQLKRICSNEWGNVLSGTRQIRFKSYEKSSLTKVRALSEGGQAVVELVTAPGLPVPVVAKLFVGELANSYGLHEAFLQMKDEIRTLLTTQCNPHIVSLYGYVVDKHRIQGLLMEHCKGGSLDSVITSAEDYSESSIIRWTLHAACGLDFIHTSNTIHRDVKPYNMLLDENHQLLKIGDLGIVKMGTIISDVLHCENTSDRGTRGYRAPEIIYGDAKTSTQKLDVFGLGRSMWNMIFRCNPKDTLDETLAMKVTVSPTIWAYVQRMMAINPESRPPMAEVYKFFEGQEQPPTLADRQEESYQEPQRKRFKHADNEVEEDMSIIYFKRLKLADNSQPESIKEIDRQSAEKTSTPKKRAQSTRRKGKPFLNIHEILEPTTKLPTVDPQTPYDQNSTLKKVEDFFESCPDDEYGRRVRNGIYKVLDDYREQMTKEIVKTTQLPRTTLVCPGIPESSSRSQETDMEWTLCPVDRSFEEEFT